MVAITEKSRVAVDALVELARRDGAGPVPIVEIAERRGIAVHVLEQVFTALRRGGILRSQRGVRGGYTLRRAAAQVSVLDVVEAVDGPLAVDAGGIWERVRASLTETLSGCTIADLAEAERAAAPMFYI